MALTSYTSYAAIRSVLGVSDDELEDVTIALPMYEYGLVLELEDINSNVPDEYDTVSAIAEASRTAAQQRFYQGVQLFAPYAVARQLGVSLPMFGPKDISDGKATVGRFADSPYKATLERIDTEYTRWRDRLESAYADLMSGSTTAFKRTLMAASSPTSDPVAGT